MSTLYLYRGNSKLLIIRVRAEKKPEEQYRGLRGADQDLGLDTLRLQLLLRALAEHHHDEGDERAEEHEADAQGDHDRQDLVEATETRGNGCATFEAEAQAHRLNCCETVDCRV